MILVFFLLLIFFSSNSTSLLPLSSLECLSWCSVYDLGQTHCNEICSYDNLYAYWVIPSCSSGACIPYNGICGQGKDACGQQCYKGCSSGQVCIHTTGQCITPYSSGPCTTGSGGACYSFDYSFPLSAGVSIPYQTYPNAQLGETTSSTSLEGEPERCICVKCNYGYGWDSEQGKCILTCLGAGGVPTGTYKDGCFSSGMADPSYYNYKEGNRWCSITHSDAGVCIGCAAGFNAVEEADETYVCKPGCSLDGESCNKDADCCYSFNDNSNPATYARVPGYACYFNKCNCKPAYNLRGDYQTANCYKTYEVCNPSPPSLYACFQGTSNPYNCLRYFPDPRACCYNCMTSDYNCGYPVEVY